MDLRVQRVSAFSTDNASGKHSSVFLNLKKVNDRSVAILDVKNFKHFTSSAKRTAALTEVFAFLDIGEECCELLHRVTSRWQRFCLPSFDLVKNGRLLSVTCIFLIWVKKIARNSYLCTSWNVRMETKKNHHSPALSLIFLHYAVSNPQLKF
jgi:hypothetical protein